MRRVQTDSVVVERPSEPLQTDILDAASKVVRAIPPAFPLEATVAVNPFLGQMDDDLATASARLERVAGVRAVQKGADYAAAIGDGRLSDQILKESLEASTSPLKPVDVVALKNALQNVSDESVIAYPTVAELAADVTGIDWPSVIKKTTGSWATGYFDHGQALWSPKVGEKAYDSWRAWAANDLTPEIAGLSGFCSHVSAAPDTSERAVVRAAQALGLMTDSIETVLHRLLMDLGGWSQHARWLLWQAELQGKNNHALFDLLAIRLVWEEALLAQFDRVRDAWLNVVDAHAEPVEPTEDMVLLAILQDAMERVQQHEIKNLLARGTDSRHRPYLQAAFCIDVRSEIFRRALESLDPSIETIGFAGFFGLPIAHRACGSDIREARLPALLKPTLETSSHQHAAGEHPVRIAARSRRAWGRFRQAAVSSFAFVESVGILYAVRLFRDAIGLHGDSRSEEPPPYFYGGLAVEEKVATARSVLTAMGMTKNFGKIVLLLGHRGQMTNNPHTSAYHCGACGGYTGDVSVRLLTALLNDKETRAGLAETGLVIGSETLFVAGIHNTTTDDVRIFPERLPEARANELRRLRVWLAQAGNIARTERAPRLPRASARTIAGRARNWAELRPEWGLAGCTSFIAAPRSVTRGRNLRGRAFLHDYNWRQDEDFSILELILTAPVIVASWISLQYYGSVVAPAVFGGGNKLIHNVVGGIGVIEGNSGRLRPGLPQQSVHDGENYVHAPLRLSVMVEAPRDAIGAILQKQTEPRCLFDNGWLHLFALKNGRIDARYRRDTQWTDMR